MQNRKIEFTIKNISLYLLGFVVVGFGVVTMLRSQLGAGAWDTVTANLQALIGDSFTLGMTSAIISTTIMLVVVFYTKKWVLVFMLLPIFFVSTSIDFWDITVFREYLPDTIVLKVLFFLSGAICIPFGLALVVTSKFPAFVFDEFTIMLMGVFKTENVTRVRFGVEIGGISLGIMFGFLAGIKFGAVNIGSVIMAILLPPTFNFFLKVLGAMDETNEVLT